jgi:hypothetical protein
MTTSKTSGRLAEFLDSVKVRIEEIFVAHAVPAEAAADILSETLSILVWRWETIRNREAWLIAMVERKARLASGKSPVDPWDEELPPDTFLR